MVNFVSKSEKKLTDFQQEYDNFLKPIDDITYVEHIGWVGEYYPVFKTEREQKLSKKLWRLANKHKKLNSYGLETLFVKDKNDIKNPSVVLKTEDWLDSCLPNDIKEKDIKDYIKKRNREIKKDIENKYGVNEYKSKKIDMKIDSGFESYYGTYVYIGTK